MSTQTWNEFRKSKFLERPAGVKITEYIKEIGKQWKEHKHPLVEKIQEKIPPKIRNRRKILGTGVSTDSIQVDIALLIRLLEFAREDASSDLDLHYIAENMVSKGKRILKMKDYKSIVKKGGRILPSL